MTNKTNKANNANNKEKNIRGKFKKGIFVRLSKYVLRQWPLFILALLLTLGSNQLSLLGPRYSGAAYRNLVDGWSWTCVLGFSNGWSSKL